MARTYRRVTVVTLAIDCTFFIICTPFKLFKRGLWLRRRQRSGNLDSMSGIQFERYVADILRRHGYLSVRLTERYDYGVDIIAEKDGIRWGIQVKRHSGLVKAAAVRQVVTALKIYDCDRAMVISNSCYSRVAISLARSNDCVLVDRHQLVGWLR